MTKNAAGAVDMSKASASQDEAHASILDELRAHRAELEAQNTQLRQTELELEAIRDQYRLLYDEAPMGYVTLDGEGTILRANRRVTELFGRPTAADLPGRPLAAFLDQESADELHRHLAAVRASGAEETCTLRLNRLSSSPSILRVHSRHVGGWAPSTDPFADERLLVVLEDVTNEHLVTQQLIESEQRFRQFAEVMEDIFYVRQADGRFEYLSPAFESITGCDAAVFCEGRSSWEQIVVDEDRALVVRALSNGVKGDPIDCQYRVRQAGAGLRWIHDRAFAIRDELGGVKRFVGVMRDITNEHELQAELRHAQTMEVVGTLASGIAHDFRNLLQGIIGCVTLALDPRTDAETTRQRMLDIGSAARRGTALTDQLTHFGKKDSLGQQAVHFDVLLRELVSVVKRVVGEHIAVELVSGAPGVVVRADHGDIERILLNVASNAADAMTHGGTLAVRTSLVEFDEGARQVRGLNGPGSFVRFDVTDTGTGMTEQVRSRIFEPFFTTKGVGRGSGLGLANVFATMRRLGGSVEVNTAPGCGTCFSFHLPCSLALETAHPPSKALPRITGTVLLAEDDRLVRMTIEHYLREAGLSVIAVDGARAALDCLTTAPHVRAVVTDVMMPEVIGPVLVESARRMGMDVPVLYLSAHDKADLVRRGVLRQEDVVLQKPVERQQLLEVLQAMMERPPRVLPSCESGERRTLGQSRGRVFVVDDCDATRMVFSTVLERVGYRVLAFENPTEALRAPERDAVDLLITDLGLPEIDGIELAAELTALNPHLEVVYVSGASALPNGTRGTFLRKPVDIDVLVSLVDQTLLPLVATA